MKLISLQENIKKAVNLASHFISNKAQLPILANILIKADKTKLTLSATNLENSITVSIAAKIEQEGEICVNGKVLNDVISNLNPSTIEISVSKEQLKLTSSNFKTNILGSNTADFPKLPTGIDEKSIVLPAAEFVNCLNKILFSVSLDETRPVLTGILFSFKENSLSLVSSDGFRLSEIKFKTKIVCDDFDLIVPKSILNEIVKVEEENEIKIFFDKANNQIIFKVGDILFSSRVIEGKFPDYQKIIPQKTESVVNIDKAELEKAIKLASVFARDSGNIVKLKIKENKLIVNAESSVSGNQEVEMELRSEEPLKSELEIMFNFKFIEDVLKVIEDEEVQIKIVDANTAAIFVDLKSSNFIHLIMPIKSQS